MYNTVNSHEQIVLSYFTFYFKTMTQKCNIRDIRNLAFWAKNEIHNFGRNLDEKQLTDRRIKCYPWSRFVEKAALCQT